ncbi:hypothetical protein [Pseudofulvibacter geojedonensis]|uniref:Uncharacterized protein n=1 Tax=Pseudofulvibacter geojedonensis TaxID=1123758 RepID=A0ABW3I0M1_9FLAO
MFISNNPFLFFESLLEPNGYNKCKNLSISNLEESVKSYLESVDYEKGEVKFWHLDHHPDTGEPFTDITTFNFDEEFPNKIVSEKAKIKTQIDELVTEINKKGKNHTEFLKSQINHTNFLLDKLSEQYNFRNRTYL